MLAALLALLFLGGGGGGFGLELFGKDNQKLVRSVVSDPARAEVAKATLKKGDEDLKAVEKQFGKLERGFGKADKAQSAGVDELTPFFRKAVEQRRIAQEKGLDCLFELRKTLTEDEWNKVFASVK